MMKKNRQFIFICFLFITLGFFGLKDMYSQQLAFPGAEGFGKYTTGGRGGEVYIVTNLNDDGPGSFRDAVSKSNRIVVFEVGGVINITSRIVIYKNITIAGQTAPGDGITIYGNGIAFNSSSGNNIIRYLRIRMGANGDAGKDAIGISDGQNYIFDHVSVSWGRDGTFDINGSYIDKITIQNCIIGQGVNVDNHSTGGLMQSGDFSLIRTLFIDNKTRNPKGRSNHEYINNVVYNWGTNGYILGGSTTATEAMAWANIIGSYFIAGPSVSGGAFTEGTQYFTAYVSDNYIDNNKDGILNGTLVPSSSSSYAGITLMDTPFDHPGVAITLPAEDAFYYVMDNAGASKVRDAVDEYLIDELKSLGTKGAIVTTESDNGIAGNVGVVNNGTPPTDTDRDGMPDDWETANGLNPSSNADTKLDADGDGYTNIEEYINSLVGYPAPQVIIDPFEGKVTAERFKNVPGTTVMELFESVDFPINPTTTETWKKLESPENIADDYGTRVRGFIHPAESGEYTFFIAGDDVALLYLSTDTTVANASLIAQTTEVTLKNEWTKSMEQKSKKIMLSKDSKYYFEVLHKESSGNDHFEVAWAGPGFTVEIIEGKYLSAWANQDEKQGVTHIRNNQSLDYKIYPNPFKDNILIELPVCFLNNTIMQVYNSIGVLLYEKEIKENSYTVNLNGLDRGIYILKLSNKQESIVQRIIKK